MSASLPTILLIIYINIYIKFTSISPITSDGIFDGLILSIIAHCVEQLNRLPLLNIHILHIFPVCFCGFYGPCLLYTSHIYTFEGTVNQFRICTITYSTADRLYKCLFAIVGWLRYFFYFQRTIFVYY